MSTEWTALPGMKIYYLYLLLRGPAWTTEQSPELAQLHQAHLAHLRSLREAGHTIITGPVLDGGPLKGFGIFCVSTQAEAAALAAQDPAVQAGRFVFEIRPWMAPAGILPEGEAGGEPGAA
jgi:uncharacterized protein YciI